MFFRKKEDTAEIVNLKKKEDDSGEQWDKKRILIIAFFIFALVLGVKEIKTAFFPSEETVLGETSKKAPTPIKKPDVELPRFNAVDEFGSRVNEIKKNIEDLDAKEVASSSPQIQKLLKDMQGIKDLPSNEAKNACMKICSEI